MNEVIEKPLELPVETEKSSGAWIRAQFQDSTGEERSEVSQGVETIKPVDRGDEARIGELDGSLQHLAAALLKTVELPVQAFEETWSQKLDGVESRLSQQADALATATNEMTVLETTVDKIKKGSSERAERVDHVTTEVERLRLRMDAFEADLGRQFGQVSSSIEKLHGEITAQQTKLEALVREGDSRTEVAENISRVLDALKTSVNLLGASPEPDSN